MSIREEIERMEQETLSRFATCSVNSRGREREEEPCPIRTCFQRDIDRIVHCKAFRRLKHKTQVFLQPEGDHYTQLKNQTLWVAGGSRRCARGAGLGRP